MRKRWGTEQGSPYPEMGSELGVGVGSGLFMKTFQLVLSFN